MKKDIYADVTNRIVESLEAGVAPWVRPWKIREYGPLRNAVTGRPYRGINTMLLSMTAMAGGFADPRWLTIKQANNFGGKIRKGEKGTSIVFWKFLRKEENPNTDEERVAEADRLESESQAEVKVIPLARMYTVFNVQQCEGLSLAPLDPPGDHVGGEINQVAEQMLSIANVSNGGNKAYYAPGPDRIGMPARDTFVSLDLFYGTGLHELAHWTGHKSRLARKFTGCFGDEGYAFEELVAEIGSAFLCAEARLPFESMRHPEYIAGWLKALKNDKRAIFTAAGQAQRAADFVMSEAGLLSSGSQEATGIA